MLKHKRLHLDQRGITLIEMTVAVALIGLIAAGIAMTISQVMAVNSRTSGKMVALRQVQQAGDRVSKDVLQAEPPAGPWEDDGFPLTLLIPYWAQNTTDGLQRHKVIYSLEGDELKREYYDDKDSGVPDYTNIVARYIDPDNTSFLPDPDSDGFIFKVTAGFRGQTETREYKVEPRPGS
jgi:prepilin-type N-terminal cleavage/methylation domain-containing protein